MNKIETTEGIKLASSMLRAGYLAERAGKKQVVISYGINHSIFNDKPYWFTEDDRQKFQTAIRTIGSELILVQLKVEPDIPESNPWCGGRDWVEKFKTLRKRVSLPYLFGRIGKSKAWYSNRITSPTKVYGKFKPEEIEEINNALHQMALELCSIELIPDTPEQE